MSNKKSRKDSLITRIKTSCRNILKPSSQTLTPSASPSRPEAKGDIEKVFRYLDENKDGKISPAELQRCVKAVGAQRLSIEEAEAAVECSDSDGDGLLSLEDFEELMRGGELSEDEKTEDLRSAFVMYTHNNNKDGSGVITATSLNKMLSRLGHSSITLEDCIGIIRLFDVDDDGVLSFHEFLAMMS